MARDPSGMRDAACDTGNGFTWRGESRAASTANVKLTRGHVGGWMRERARCCTRRIAFAIARMILRRLEGPAK